MRAMLVMAARHGGNRRLRETAEDSGLRLWCRRSEMSATVKMTVEERNPGDIKRCFVDSVLLEYNPRRLIMVMGAKSGSLDYWRKYFRSANSNIFEVIENAIIAAASDCPKEFKIMRDQIAERLFSCRLSNYFGFDHVKEEGDEGFESDFDGIGDDFVSKVNSSTDDHGEMKMNQVSNCSYDELEALMEEIEDESEIVGESNGVLFDSLRRLQLMALSVDILKVIEWKNIVDEWVSATAAITEGSPDSVNPSVVDDEEGLPSPPWMKEYSSLLRLFPWSSLRYTYYIFLIIESTLDSRNSGEINKNFENGRKSSMLNHNIIKRKQQQQQLPHEANEVIKDKNDQQKKQVAVIRQTKPSNTESGPGKPPKPSSVQKFSNEIKFQQKSGNVAVQKRQLPGQQDKSKCSNEVLVQMKLEASKRKLHQGYLQADNGSSKKQRTIQVMELCDLPKQGLGHKNPLVKRVNHNRNWANGRH
ncbi:hypothetical protein HHK36_019691 [Tetracentron sinense]|uniref:Uncharacterized protein n=1 Tax=Tetracentron sinense TaxID=13715 RepID=A0A834YXT8_TETSI|nr:hypothetical protein HHK36_019691 [Tetracentron sinense]